MTRRREDKFPDNGFEAWGGYMQAKIAKLEEQYAKRAGHEEKETSIFSGIGIYVNGFTIPSADELKQLMSKHGGVYHTYQRSDDYIIASNLPDTKVKNMSLAKVIRPEWITDSISAKRLLDYRDYLLYRNSKSQPRLDFSKHLKLEHSINENKSSIQTNVADGNSIKHMKMEEHMKSTELPKKLVNKYSPEHDLKKPLEINKLTNSPLLPNSGSVSYEANGICDQKSGPLPKTAANPNFISEFYNNSRLHHISQLGACFKQYVNDLRSNSNFTFPARSQLRENIQAFNKLSNSPQIVFEKGKIIMHIDMDCFFVSVGLRNRPDLRGKPVAVTHSKGGQGRLKVAGVDRNIEFNLYRQRHAKKIEAITGNPDEGIDFESRFGNITDEDDKYGSMSEIASCSYEARAKGIKNGMFMGAALKLCPDLLTIPYDFEGYKEVAYMLYNTLAQYTLDIEAVSCDEMYVDCTGFIKDMEISVQDFATVLRAEIKSKTGCPCSTGFGGNRLQARLATKKAKPDGQFFLTADLVEDFMFDIKLNDLPGVGIHTTQKLESLGHQTCGSLQSLSLGALQHHLGNKTGILLFNQCRGRDENPLTFFTVRKSVSAEVNYGIRFENNEQCVEFLKQLSAEVQLRMQQFKVIGKCITLKLMVRAKEAPVETAKFLGHGFCDIINKSSSLNKATNDIEIITKEVISLCKKQNVDPREMRGIGIQITKLEAVNSNKTTKGAISKYLSNVKNNKVDNKLEVFSDLVVHSKPGIAVKTSTTPKKHKIMSPKQRSPIIKLLSPTSKRRGRPPKNSKPPQSTSINLMNRFLQGQSATFKDTPYIDPMIKDVKKEIPKKEQKLDGLLGFEWQEVRELLRAWLECGQTPLPCDICMISDYMRESVINKNIDQVQILLNFLQRRTNEMGNIDWKQVYEHVVEQVQNTMLAVYGKRLFIS